MKALIVGAGAVGRVLGTHLVAAGSSVTLLTRPGRRDAALGPLWTYPLNTRSRWRDPVAFRPDAVLDDVGRAVDERWDVVIVAVPSPALRRGDWLERLSRARVEVAWLALQPGPDDAAVVAEHVPAERVVWMAFGLLAVAVPLPDQLLRQPGIAYWWPPGGGLQLSGADSRAARLAAAFSCGGLPARLSGDVVPSIAFGSAVLDTLAAGLECAGWSFARFCADRRLLALTCRAARQAAEAAARRLDVPVPPALALLHPMTLSWGLGGVASRMLPIPLEPYFEAHFGKLGEQTRASLTALAASVDCDAIAMLLDALQRSRSPHSERQHAQEIAAHVRL